MLPGLTDRLFIVRDLGYEPIGEIMDRLVIALGMPRALICLFPPPSGALSIYATDPRGGQCIVKGFYNLGEKPFIAQYFWRFGRSIISVASESLKSR